ncbi:MAG TPA: PAS domain S-box protein [Azospira sp.]|nr:PAS domain S-box protein [Azospira sp.]
MTSPDAPSRPPSEAAPPARPVLGVVLAYAAFAALWILLSDRLLLWLFSDPVDLALASTLKGWAFVLCTSLLLLGLLRRRERAAGVPRPPLAPRRPLLPFALLTLAIVAITAAGIGNLFVQQERTEVARLQAIADLKARQIGDWLHERQVGDGDMVRHAEGFAEQFRRWQKHQDAAAAADVMEHVEQWRRSRDFSAVTLVDGDGRPVWRSPQAPEILAPELQAAVAVAAREGRVERVGPYRGIAGRTRVDFVAPLHRSVPGAVVVLHALPENWLYPTLQSWPVPSASAETVLLRRDGDEVLYLNELRFRPDAAARFRQPLANEKLLAARVLRGAADEGAMVRGVDYRGVDTLGVVRSIPDTDWFLLAKVDRSELYAPVIHSAAWVGLAGTLALFVAGAALVILRQRERLLTAEAVRAAQGERLRALGLLAAVADSSVDAIYAKDPAGRYLLFNQAAGRIVGKLPEEVIGRDDHAIFPAAQAAALQAADAAVIAAGEARTQEEVLDTALGRRTFLTTKGPLRDNGGGLSRISGVFGISRDITDLRLADDSLRESERRFRTLFEYSPVPIHLLSADGTPMLVNHAFERLLGYRAEELIGRPFAEWTHPDDVAASEEVWHRLRAGDADALDLEKRYVHRDGSVVWAHTSVAAVRDDGGALVYVIAMAEDISERKVAEEALRQQAEEVRGRNQELERFNRAMVGRELDMVALKRQINALCGELGRPPAYPQTFLDDAAAAAPTPAFPSAAAPAPGSLPGSADPA